MGAYEFQAPIAGGLQITLTSSPLSGVRLKSTVSVDNLATCQVSGNSSLNGLTLRINDLTSPEGGDTSKDTLGISTSSPTILKRNAGNLVVGRVRIGTVTGGKKGESLIVTFNDQIALKRRRFVCRQNRTLGVQLQHVMRQ